MQTTGRTRGGYSSAAGWFREMTCSTRRSAKNACISATAAHKLTIPRPETAPLTKLLIISAWMNGKALREVIAIPELRPWREQQHCPRLKEERRQEQTHQGFPISACDN